jgi:hypothetical protein
VADGASAELQPSDLDGANKRLDELIRANRPQTPPELESVAGSNGRSLFGSPYMIRGYGWGNRPEGQLSENLMRDALARWVAVDGEPVPEIPHRSYVAITRTGPEIELGLPRAREEASFHIIAGQW